MLENWRSTDVQRDPEGFLKAQQAERERKEAEANKQQEADDLERFTRTFVAEGGDPRALDVPALARVHLGLTGFRRKRARDPRARA